tara:strand:+ start:128 stop:484 length:357 start_codon:yes stop_codon:yes gene_type:complete
MNKYFNRQRLMEIAGLKEAVAQPNTILVTRMNNGNTDMQFPNPQEMDSDTYADALEMAEDKYARGTKIEFIYMDAAGKSHEGEVELRGDSDYEGPYFEDDKDDSVRDKAVIDLFDKFS